MSDHVKYRISPHSYDKSFITLRLILLDITRQVLLGENMTRALKCFENIFTDKVFRYRFSTTLQSGTVFYQKKVEKGSTVEPKRLHFLKSGTVFNLFLENYGKRLHCGAVLANGTTLVRGTIFFSNMIIKEKLAPLLKSGAVFQNSSMVEPF